MGDAERYDDDDDDESNISSSWTVTVAGAFCESSGGCALAARSVRVVRGIYNIKITNNIIHALVFYHKYATVLNMQC